MKKIILIIFILFACFSCFSQTEENITSTITAQINGNSFRSVVKNLSTETSYEINGGNETEGIKIMWNTINSESQIKTGSFEFPATKDILIGYVNYNNGKPYAVKQGFLIITKNEDNKITGTFNFTFFDGLPSELGGSEIRVTNGKFTIHY